MEAGTIRLEWTLANPEDPSTSPSAQKKRKWIRPRHVYVCMCSVWFSKLIKSSIQDVDDNPYHRFHRVKTMRSEYWLHNIFVA